MCLKKDTSSHIFKRKLKNIKLWQNLKIFLFLLGPQRYLKAKVLKFTLNG